MTSGEVTTTPTVFLSQTQCKSRISMHVPRLWKSLFPTPPNLASTLLPTHSLLVSISDRQCQTFAALDNGGGKESEAYCCTE